MLRFVRWLARIWSILSIIFILVIFFGEGFHPGGMSGIEWILFIFFPVGILAGMIRGWTHEALGGSVVVFSIIAFYLLNYIDSGRWPSGPYFLLAAFPGFLYLGCGMFSHSEKTS